MNNCDICPRNCRSDRLNGQKGFCQTAKEAFVYTSFLHQGEEPGISAGKGSGAVFFSGCNLKCLYCQNFRFSQDYAGEEFDIESLAYLFLNLENQGAANINLVTPSHVLPQILAGLVLACEQGLNLPLVYNTSGYEKNNILAHLEGIIDIYLTDLKYINPETAKIFSNAPDYPQYALESIKEMYKQTNNIWDKDVLKQGLIIRHLVLPGYIEESKLILKWIKDNCPRALASVMFQYQPYHQAKNFPQISRRLSFKEYEDIKSCAQRLELEGWMQEYHQKENMAGVHFQPGFEKT
ncbi:MAG: radical SAM protein [Candidatus Omnitrophica bacterium]|nr:radical SAM protein [Candidatus Omnitrophota bacterium]